MPKKQSHRRDGIYERPDRPGFWGSWTDASGRRRRRQFKVPTLTQARALLAAEKARADELVTKGYASATKDTFASIAPRYLRHQRPQLSEKSYRRTSGILENQLLPVFGAMQLGKIRRSDIQKYVTDRSGEVAPGSILKELNVLKHFLGLAAQWELIPFNPAVKIKTPRVPAGRVRYLQPNELRALLEACPEWLRPIAGLAAFTAMRRGEILKMRWIDVDLEGGRILLPQTKNGDGRVVYMNELAADVIRSQWRMDAKSTDRVFTISENCTDDNISKGFSAVCRRLKIEDFSFHDLRHTAASWLRMQGADIHTVAQLLGHKDLRMATRYQHLSPEFLSAAVGRLDAIFGEPVLLTASACTDSEKSTQAGEEPCSIVTIASPSRKTRPLSRAKNRG